ncbi:MULTISPECIES: ABC transporter permease [Prauserella salsuginis group]|uniref:ABC-2 type transport system permease protein n=2 Tax=Prauserella salsuginis group TaxID=2893672 RepID=A0A839XIR1_9PSEU|nr:MULTISPECIES: ABC transporter permease subunit [Prauserella salsuginis group]MBB3663842.1 ABC-2 type transport system permease protein [Prauserella sediminis]MCR3722376.1 ABC-2 type transport system permease protein [Prauserella flava]MCR3736818.1 ABC-2 type transport system permease protein [Prauserella salsuginis]
MDVMTKPARRTAPASRLVRAELRWIFRRPRTLAVLGLLALIPVIMGIALTVADPTAASSGGPPGNDGGNLLPAAAASVLVLPIAALTMTLQMLLPLAAAMSGADALAGETSTGTLRGWLLAPVGRAKLLLVKALGVATFTLAAAAVIAATGILTALVINGDGTLSTLSGTTLSIPDAVGRVALAVGWVTLQLWAVGAIALAISAFTEHPMVVLASVLGGVIVFTVLGSLDALSWLHPFLLTEVWWSLVDVLRDPVPAADLIDGGLKAACYLAIGLSLAYARLVSKDG